MKTGLLVVFLLAGSLFHPVFAQTVNMDAILEQYPEDTSRVNALNELAYGFHRDAPDEAIRYGLEALDLAERLKFQSGIASANKNIGLGYYMKTDYIEAFRFWENARMAFEMMGDKMGAANMVGNIGGIYLNTGKLVEAVKSYLRALEVAEQYRDSTRIASNLSNLGLTYSKQSESLDSARSYYLRSLKIYESIGPPEYVGIVTFNLGEVFYMQEAYDSALSYFNRSLSLVSGRTDRSSSLHFMGEIYTKKKEYQRAFTYYEQALTLAREENSRHDIVKILLGLGGNYMEQGEPQEALSNFEQAVSIARELDLNEELSEAYLGLSQAYAGLVDYRNAFKYLALHDDVENVVFKIETDKEMSNMMFSYQLDKKDAEIEILEQQSEIEQLKTRRQKAMNIAMGSVGLFLLIIAGLFYQRFKYVRRTNAQIQDQKEEIEAQRDQIMIQRDLVASQKQDITDSINYARRIQSAVLPSKKLMDHLMPEYFILLKPRDIVSGDFYWVKEVQDHLMIVGADCTGHGVPGAFMSMLGITLLNDLVIDCSCEKPGQVLGKLRAKVKMMLDHDGIKDYQKDGMEMALMVIDRKRRELQFAGANQPLYLIRSGKHRKNGDLDPYTSLEYNGYGLFELKGDRQPIGTYWEEKEFNSYSIELFPEDSLYIFSDGIIDQYGGSNRKKYKAVNFKKLLLSIQPETMQQQKMLIENEFENWRGNHEQIDDVSVIGVRIS